MTQHDFSQARPITRRRVTQAAAVALALPLIGPLAACGKKTQASTVVYAGYGGPYEDAMRQVYFEPIEQAQQIQVKVTTGAEEFEKIRAMVQSGNVEYDVIDCTGPIYARFLAEDLLQPMPDALKARIHADDFSDPTGIDDFSFPLYAYPHCIFWNSKLTGGRALESWADVWDVEKFPGKRLFQRFPQYLFEEALMADGVPPHALYPLDIPRVLKKLDAIRAHAEFLESNTIQNLVAQGEIVTGDMNYDRVMGLRADGVPLEFNWNQPVIDYVRWAVPKGAKNPENAWKLIESTLDASRQVEIFKLIGYGPTLKKALENPDVASREFLAGNAKTLERGVVLSPVYYKEHGEEARQAMHDWLING